MGTSVTQEWADEDGNDDSSDDAGGMGMVTGEDFDEFDDSVGGSKGDQIVTVDSDQELN